MPNRTFNCIIIEDERNAAIVLEHHIKQFPSLLLTGKFSSVSLAANILNNKEVDLIFLDINLPGTSGIDFAKTTTVKPAIIFTTAYPNYAIEGFDVDAVDYLLKPISFERFSKAVNKFLWQNQQQVVDVKEKAAERQFVFVKCDRRLIKIFIDEILYLEAQRNALIIFTKDETCKTYHSIAEMEERLPAGLFLRVHRSFIIALDKVESFSASTVVTQQHEVPIGRLYRKAVLEVLQKDGRVM
jgi:DNA-binding LytR/AlgR family response regulator